MDESALRRREFLGRTASVAGLAGAASVLPASTLIEEAAAKSASRLPSPRNMPIDHFVVVMMENRSFDHYFGWLDQADAKQDMAYTDPQGTVVRTRHASTLEAAWQGCGHPDPGHGWNSGRAQLRDGFLAEGSGNDEFALTYYEEGELEYIHAVARRYTVYDRFFCSVPTSTWPNRYYVRAVGRQEEQRPAAGHRRQPVGDRLRPRALARGDSAVLQLRPAVLGGVGRARRVVDAAAGRVLRRLRGGDAAEHLVRRPAVPRRRRRRRPVGRRAPARRRPARAGVDGRRGQRVRAVAELPPRRALRRLRRVGRLLRARHAAERRRHRQSSNLDEDFGQMGFRIPAVAVSPYARKRKGEARVSHQRLGFESIIKLTAWGTSRSATPAPRTSAARSTGGAARASTPPTCPIPSTSPHGRARWAAATCSRSRAPRPTSTTSAPSRRSPTASTFPVGEGKASDLFTKPDSLLRAARSAR